jgi:transposase
LTPEEKQELEQLINQWDCSSPKVDPCSNSAQSNCNQEQGGWTDQAIHQAIDLSLSTIARVRQIFVEQGLDAALNSKPSSQLRLRKLDRVAEAGLIACCCSQPPPGRKEWTLRLLADEMVKLEYVNSISHETVRQVLKKTKSSLG